MATFVFVAGAWLGGWCWRDVASRLRAGGHAVITATLSGVGERAHLISREISLETHVSDIAGLLHYRDLTGVTLVGHSYGGTVITAVAERHPDRIGRLVYLDASVPRDGESNNGVIGAQQTTQLRSWAEAGGDGWRVPLAPYVLENLAAEIRPWVEERLTPHPLRVFEEPVKLRSAAAAVLPRAFLQTSLQSELYRGLMSRARAAGWYCRELKGGHYPMLREPQVVAAALSELPVP
jgi:pimeloyl-ACP methyl ester carboxylesterase